MYLFLLFFAENEFGWERWIGEGVAISVVIVILIFVLKALPTWKEIKLAEINVRKQEAEAFGKLSGALGQIGTTLHSVAVEQRKATDMTLVMQRVAADEGNNLSASVDELNQRMDEFESIVKQGTQNGPNSKRNS